MKHAFESFVPVGGISLTLVPGDHEITAPRLWVEIPVTIAGTRYESGIYREFKTPLPSGEVTVIPVAGKIQETDPLDTTHLEGKTKNRIRENAPRGGWIRLTCEIAPTAKPVDEPPKTAPAQETDSPQKDPDPAPPPKKKK